jgi:dihydropyrimidinase
VIDVLTRAARERGHTEPHWHAATRPALAEAEATNRAIQLARIAECPLYVVHVSCKEALAPVARARANGWDVSAETCTHYLFLDESLLHAPDFEGAKYVFAPPPRTKDDQNQLWRALQTGVLTAVSSDHVAFTLRQKAIGRDDFSKIPNGAPGIEDRLAMLWTFGVRSGLISPNRLVELVSTGPAKTFGLYPKKGSIAIGSDADLVVWDPESTHVRSAASHHSNADYNLFEGTQVTGAVDMVISRGRVVVAGGNLIAAPGHGRFVARARRGDLL